MTERVNHATHCEFLRGGNFITGPFAGPFTIIPARPSLSFDIVGFRCAR